MKKLETWKSFDIQKRSFLVEKRRKKIKGTEGVRAQKRKEQALASSFQSGAIEGHQWV
jgi:hypothetical protein